MTKRMFLVSLAVILLVSLVACDPAKSASFAGDGNTQFGNGGNDPVNRGSTGKLRFGVTYKAVAETPQQRSACEWKIYTVNIKTHATTVVGRGDYATAKIRVAEPSTVQVFLRSLNCGLWK